MVNLYFDRVIEGNNIPNGIPKDHVGFYFPDFKPVDFRKTTGVEPAVYPSEFGHGHSSVYRTTKSVSSIKKSSTECLGIYPIEGFGSARNAVACDTDWNKKFKSSFYYMSDKVKQYLKDGTLKLYFGLIQEAFINDDEIIAIHKEMKKYEIENGIVAVNDFLAENRYKYWCKKNKEKVRFNVIIFSHSLFEKSYETSELLTSHNVYSGMASEYKKHTSSAMSHDEFLNTKEIKREKHLLCLNRRQREHRLATLCVLSKNNLIKNNSVSFQFTMDTDVHTPYYIEHIISDKEKYEDLRIEYDKLKKMKYQYVDYPIAMEAKNGMHHGYGWENHKPYLDTYFSIVTETAFLHPTGYVSEKSWKPIAFFHPFILVGSPGSLKFIREYGFKTFSPFIDESYDDVKTPVKRFKLIEKEIVRLGKMSKQEIHDWYWSMEDILTHNFKLFNEYGKNHGNIYDDFFKNIFNLSDEIFIPEFRKK
jgi:hypothetical protein